MTTLDEVSVDLDRASRLIAVAHEMTDGGNVVDLTGLDDVVQQACARIEEMPEGDRATVKPLLVSLIDSLNGLVVALEARQGEVAGEIEDISSRSKASTAYGKGAAIGRKNENP